MPTISTRTARELLRLLPSGPAEYTGPRIECIRAELERALSRQTRRKPKSRAKRDDTAAVRAAVFERAKGVCECCMGISPFMGLQLDHFFGRSRAGSLETCWALSPECHQAKTDNNPSARFWLEKFRDHCGNHGYRAEAERARARLEGMVAIREAESLRTKGLTREGP